MKLIRRIFRKKNPYLLLADKVGQISLMLNIKTLLLRLDNHVFPYKWATYYLFACLFLQCAFFDQNIHYPYTFNEKSTLNTLELYKTCAPNMCNLSIKTYKKTASFRQNSPKNLIPIFIIVCMHACVTVRARVIV